MSLLSKPLRVLKQVLGKKNKNAPVTHPLAKFMIEQGSFDEKWYLASYPDIAADKHWQKNPAMHYLLFGAREGRRPTAWFDSAFYLATYPDVVKNNANPFIHFLQHGKNEGRKPNNYLLLNPQLAPDAQLTLTIDNRLCVDLPLKDNAEKLQLSVMIGAASTDSQGILFVEWLNVRHEPINTSFMGPLKFSETFKKWYRYLSPSTLNEDVFVIPVPAAAATLRLSIKAWQGDKLWVKNALTPLWLKTPEVHTRLGHSQALKFANEIKVAFLADEFTFNSFKDEFIAVTFEPDNWREIFDKERPQLFFCESAWSGIDPKKRPWKGKVYASENFARENRTTLIEILAYCKQHGIPTLFWNKEDPTHFVDRKHDFVKTAVLFDYVFTSAEECVAQYQSDYGVKHAFALPFATNPRLFNPMQNGARSNKVVFAGSWYANHVERSIVMEQVLDTLLASGYEPEIYDRYYGDTDPLHIWPEKYLPYIKPGQPHDQMPAVYKSSVLGLNFNTVTESSTMFARRVFELMSSNTLIVSNYAKGVAEMFGDLVVFADQNPGRLASLSGSEVDHIREQALQLVLQEHTYAKRWRYMLNCIGFKFKPDNQGVTLVSRIASDAEAMASISYFEQHYGRSKDCCLLLIVSSDVPDLDVAGFYQKYNRFGITVTAESFMQKHALDGLYQPIETPYFMLFDVMNTPNPDWLKEAMLHLSYQGSYPITPYSARKYVIEEVNSRQAFLARPVLFLALYQEYCSDKKILAYTV